MTFSKKLEQLGRIPRQDTFSEKLKILREKETQQQTQEQQRKAQLNESIKNALAATEKRTSVDLVEGIFGSTAPTSEYKYYPDTTIEAAPAKEPASLGAKVIQTFNKGFNWMASPWVAAGLGVEESATLGTLPRTRELAQPESMSYAKQQAEKHPIMYNIGKFAGYIPSGGLFTKGAGVVGKPVLKKIGSEALKVGAQELGAGIGMGAVEATLEGQKPLDIAKRAGTYGVLGGVGGAGVTKGMELIGKGSSKLKSQITPVVSQMKSKISMSPKKYIQKLVKKPSEALPQPQIKSLKEPDIQLSTRKNTLTEQKILHQLEPKEPITEPIKRSDIEKFLAETLDIPVAQGKFRQKAWGIFKVRSEVIRLKNTKDLDTLFHETGHFLDKKFNLSNNSQFTDELIELGTPASRNTYSAKQKIQEGVAEFVNHYIVDKQLAQNRAPNFFEYFDNTINANKELSTMFDYLTTAVDNYVKQDPEMRLLGNISIGEKTKKPSVTLGKTYSLMIDDLSALDRATKSIAGGEKIPTSENPYETARRYRGWAGKAETYLNYGIVDENFKKIGKSFKEILSSIKDSKELNSFRAYSIAKRAKTLEDRGIKTGLHINDINLTISKYKDNAVFNTTLDELYTYQNNLLDQLVKSGIVSKSVIKTMKELNKDYVPFYRVIDTLNKSVGKGMQAYNPIKGIKGSTRDILDPLESVVKNTYLFTNMIERNRVGQTLVNLANKYTGSGKFLDKIPAKIVGKSFSLDEVKEVLLSAGADIENIDLSQVATIFRPVRYRNEKVISIFKNGKQNFYEVFDDELYNTMLSIDRQSGSILEKLLSFPAKTLRAGATVLTPEYIVRNPMRDALSAFVYSKYGFIPGVDTLRGLVSVLGKDESYYKFMASGAANSTITSVDREYLQGKLRGIVKKAIKQDTKTKALNIITSPIELLRTLGEIFELSTKVGEFKKGVKKLGDSRENILEAALSARDLMDFFRAGSLGRQVNKVNAFFNASLQGTDKMIRAFKENPLRSSIRSISAITLPSVLLYVLNRDNPRYQELPQWQKDVFWIIPTPEKYPMIRIPKPFELGILFGTIPERFLQWTDKNDKKAFEGLAGRLKETFVPNLLPTIITPIVEIASNFSFFKDRPIVPTTEQNLEQHLQYGEYTSGISKAVGKLMNISPRKIEHVVRGYTGGGGAYLMQAGDIPSKLAKKELDAKSFIHEYTPIKGFTSEPYTTSSHSIDSFYKELKRLETQYNSRKKEKLKFDELNKLRAFRRTSKRLSELRNKITRVKGSDMSSDNKRQQIDKITQQMINLARIIQQKPELKE